MQLVRQGLKQIITSTVQCFNKIGWIWWTSAGDKQKGKKEFFSSKPKKVNCSIFEFMFNSVQFKHTVFCQINTPAQINAPQHFLVEYCPQNRRKLVKNDQKQLKNLDIIPLDPPAPTRVSVNAQGTFIWWNTVFIFRHKQHNNADIHTSSRLNNPVHTKTVVRCLEDVCCLKSNLVHTGIHSFEL